MLWLEPIKYADIIVLIVLVVVVVVVVVGVRGGAAGWGTALQVDKSEGRGFDSRWCHNPSGRTMALGPTQPLTEMSTRNISWGVNVAGA